MKTSWIKNPGTDPSRSCVARLGQSRFLGPEPKSCARCACHLNAVAHLPLRRGWNAGRRSGGGFLACRNRILEAANHEPFGSPVDDENTMTGEGTGPTFRKGYEFSRQDLRKRRRGCQPLYSQELGSREQIMSTMLMPPQRRHVSPSSEGVERRKAFWGRILQKPRGGEP